MGAHGKVLSLLVIGVVLTAIASAQTPTHPLSHITPTDTNFNFSANPSATPYNVTGLPWILPRDGLLSIAGDVNLRGNDLDRVDSINNYFDAACPAGEVVDQVYANGSYKCETVTSDLSDAFVNITGDTMQGNLNMGGYNITNCDYINGVDCNALGGGGGGGSQNLSEVLAQGNAAGPYSINLNDNAIYNIGDLSLANDISIAGGRVGIGRSPSALLDVDGSVEIRGDIDVNGNDLNSVGRIPNFFAGQCPAGRVIDRIFSDGSYSCVDFTTSIRDIFVNESGDTMTGTLNMSGNNIIDIGDLTGTGIVDSANIQDGSVATTDLADNSVTSPKIQNGTILSGDIATDTIQSGDIAPNAITNSELDTDAVQTGNILDGTIQADDIGSNAVGNDELNNVQTFTVGGLVLNGDLNMSGNNITAFFDGACGTDEAVKNVFPNGTFQCTDLIEAAQNVEPLNQTLAEDNRALGYNINMTGANITDIRELQDFFAGACGTDEVVTQVYANGSYQCTDVDTLSIDNQNLQEVLVHGNVANMSINMAGYGIQNVGTLNASTLQQGGTNIGDIYVNEAGDTMTGGLNMSGNNIGLQGAYLSNDGQDEGVYVDTEGQVGVGTNTPDSDLQVDGTANVSNSGTQLQMTSDGDVIITLG